MKKFKFRRILAMMLAIFMVLCSFTLTAEAAKSKPTAPTFKIAATNATGNIVTITFNKAMQNPVRQAGRFSIIIDSSTQVATAATLNGTDKIDLTIATAATYGQAITVSYTPGTVKSADGGVLAAFTAQSVTNNVPAPQTAPPTFVSAATNATGNIVTITFNKAMQNPVGQASNFSIIIGSSTQAATAATLNGTDKIDLTIATAATNGQTVTVSYAPGTVKSVDDGVLAAFTNKPVTNNVPPAAETVKYVSLGDSIASGTTGTGSNTSFANKFYNYLMNTYYPATNAGLNKTTNVEFEQDAIDGETSLDLIDWLLSDDTIDDDPLRTDELDRYDASMVADIANANIITLSIGGNDLMQHATIPGFATVDWAGAQNSANYFAATSWNWLISTIKSINGTKNAKLIVTTGYNPYNLGTVSGYESDVQPAANTESLVTQMRNAVISDNNRLENGIGKYEVADVYTDFHTYQPNRMGQITSFYPFFLLKIMRDPHPNQTGQDRILNLVKAFYPLP